MGYTFNLRSVNIKVNEEREITQNAFGKILLSGNYWGFGLCPSSCIVKNSEEATFQELDLFPCSGEGNCFRPLQHCDRGFESH
jgi:hypothetical protein